MPMYDVSIKPAPIEADPCEPCRPVAFAWRGYGMLFSAVAGNYAANVKIYPEQSHFGLLGGRIRTLEIFKEGIRVWSYDRGQYLGYLERGGREFLAALAAKFN